MRFQAQTRRCSRQGERGYIMLTLTLVMALMVIFAAAIVPSITFEIKRDREEEMIHRGVQYSRAIRTYYKKFGRYPTKIEDLENTNNLRFLRKRYKDPENCKNGKCADFKLLHFGEVQLSLSGAGAGIAGLGAAAAAAGAGGLNSNSAAGNALRAIAGSAAAQNQLGGTNPVAGLDPTQTGSASADGTSNGTSTGTSTGTTNGTSDGTSNGTGTNPSGSASGGFGNNQLTPGQIIGGPVIGVASISKETTIREFNKKKKYKDWMFVYDPAQDQGRLITTPYQPQLQGFGSQGPQNANGLNGSSTGTSGFGNGLGNSSNGQQNNPTAPTAPSNPPYGAPPNNQQ